MYIKYEDILEDDVTIDVRTVEEFSNMPLFEHNLPIISKKEHDLLKKKIYLAIPIILRGFFRNKAIIEKELERLCHYRRYRLIIGCSQGRIRSPIIYFYARYLGINVKILKGGIKPFFIKNSKTLKNLNGYLDI